MTNQPTNQPTNSKDMTICGMCRTPRKLATTCKICSTPSDEQVTFEQIVDDAPFPAQDFLGYKVAADFKKAILTAHQSAIEAAEQRAYTKRLSEGELGVLVDNTVKAAEVDVAEWFKEGVPPGFTRDTWLVVHRERGRGIAKEVDAELRSRTDG